MGLSIRFGAVLGLLRELGKLDDRPLLVAGVLADELARRLTAGGDPSAVRLGGPPEGVEILIYAVGDTITEEDERAIKSAHRARVPTLVVAAGRTVPHRIPYVLATDVVRAGPGEGFPVASIAEAIASKLGEEATSLARRLPVLRPAVVQQLIEMFARKNGVLGAAIFIRRADMPVLTVNQLRMVLRICSVYGLDADRDRVPEILATVGAGFGFRALARQLLVVVPVAGWAVKGLVAYTATRALGEAAIRYSEARTVTQPPAAASPSSS